MQKPMNLLIISFPDLAFAQTETVRFQLQDERLV